MTLKPHISNIVRIKVLLNKLYMRLSHHGSITGMLFFMVSRRIKYLVFSTLSRKSWHITLILKELHWLPVSQRIVCKLMLIVHKSVNNVAPIYISELLKVYTPSHNLRSSNMSLLKEPTSKRTWGDRSFSVAAPRLWNHRPTKLKSCHSITRFKSLLKTHLMSQFFKDDVYL